MVRFTPFTANRGLLPRGEPVDGPGSSHVPFDDTARAGPPGTTAPVVLPMRPAWQAPARVVTPGMMLAVLRRRRVTVLVGFVLGALVGASYLRWAVPVYEATASLRVDDRRSPTPDVIRTVQGADELNTEIEVVPSRTLALAVTDSLGLRVQVSEPRHARRDEVLRAVHVAPTLDSATVVGVRGRDGTFELIGDGGRVRAAPDTAVTVGGVTLTLAPGALAYPQFTLQVVPTEVAAAQALDAFTATRSGNRANLMVLHYRDADPTLARDVLNVWTGLYMAQRSAEQKLEARGAATFLQAQLDTLGRELAAAEGALREYRERENVVAPEQEATSEVSRVAALRTEREATDAERRTLGALLDTLRSAADHQAAEEPSVWRQLVGFPTLLRNPTVGSLLVSLTQVDQQRSELLNRRSMRDPEVLALTQRQHALEQQLRVTAETYVRGLSAQVAAADVELGRAGASLLRVPGQQQRLAQLQRAPRVLDGLVTMLGTRLKEAQVAQGVTDPSVRVIDLATLPIRPVAPKKAFTLVLAALCGLFAGAALAFVRELRGTPRLRTEADVAAVTTLPVLGVVPRLPAPPPRLLGALGELIPQRATRRPRARQAERAARAAIEAVYEQLYVEAAYAAPGRGPRCLLVTSPLSGEGKSTTALMLARAMARAGQLVLVIDADFRRGDVGGSLAELCGMPNGAGTAEVLSGVTTIDRVVHAVDAGQHAVYLMRAGTPTERPAALFAPSRLDALLTVAQIAFDLVIVDAPPVNVVADAAMLAPQTNGVLVVARAGATTGSDLAYALERLGRVRAPVMGVVLNDVDAARDAAYDGTYHHQARASDAYFGERAAR